MTSAPHKISAPHEISMVSEGNFDSDDPGAIIPEIGLPNDFDGSDVKCFVFDIGSPHDFDGSLDENVSIFDGPDVYFGFVNVNDADNRRVLRRKLHALHVERRKYRSTVPFGDRQDSVIKECRYELFPDRRAASRVSYNCVAKDRFSAQEPNDQPMRFKMAVDIFAGEVIIAKEADSNTDPTNMRIIADLHYYDTAGKQSKYFNERRNFQAIVGHPSTRSLKTIVAGNQIMICPILVQDIECAELIYSPSHPILKGKMTRTNLGAFTGLPDCLLLCPPTNGEMYRSLPLAHVTSNSKELSPLSLDYTISPAFHDAVSDAVNHCLLAHIHEFNEKELHDAVSYYEGNPTEVKQPYKAPSSALNIQCHDKPVATKQVYSDTPAINNKITIPQLSTSTSPLITNVYGTKRDKERGAPTKPIKCCLLALMLSMLFNVLSAQSFNGETPTSVAIRKHPDISVHTEHPLCYQNLLCNVIDLMAHLDDAFDGEEVTQYTSLRDDMHICADADPTKKAFDPNNQPTKGATPTGTTIVDDELGAAEDTTDSGQPTENTTGMADSREPTRNTTDVVPVTEKSITPVNNAATVYRHTLSDAPAPTERSSKLHDVGTSTSLAPISAAEYRTPEHGISLFSEGNFDDDNPPAVVSMAASTPDTDGMLPFYVRKVKAETQRVQIRLAKLRAAVDDGTANDNVHAFDVPVVKCFVNATNDSAAENCFNRHAPRLTAENCFVSQKPIDRPSSTRNVKTVKVLDIERAELVYDPKVPIFDDKTTRDKPFPVIYDYAALHRDMNNLTDICPPHLSNVCFATAVDYGTTVQPVHTHERDEEQFHQIYEDTLSSSTRGARGNFIVPPDDEDVEEECLHDDAHSSIVKEIATELLRADNFGIRIPRMVASTLLLRAPSTIIKIWYTMLK